jgi:hypothetical protein
MSQLCREPTLPGKVRFNRSGLRLVNRNEPTRWRKR